MAWTLLEVQVKHVTNDFCLPTSNDSGKTHLRALLEHVRALEGGLAKGGKDDFRPKRHSICWRGRKDIQSGVFLLASKGKTKRTKSLSKAGACGTRTRKVGSSQSSITNSQSAMSLSTTLQQFFAESSRAREMVICLVRNTWPFP